ncbi:hypothetical protein R3P38DRAFT_2655413 [Favolaschia claudopus]|uniref:Protein kinase domain-containing protein n=1 Tax=Favolaschia claudopus TaxID=2862362 RepID=A0AAV9ZYL2_9AGAR
MARPLSQNERAWQQLYDDLHSKGFQLRPRYSAQCPPGHKDYPIPYNDGSMNDASHATYGRVVLKFANSAEREMLEQLRSIPDANQHVLPLLSSLHAGPEGNLIVMPFFGKLGTAPYFETSKDLMCALLQVAQGVAFMHSHNIAHGAIHRDNFVEDRSQLIPGGFHFVATGWSSDLKNRIQVVKGGRSATQPKIFIVNLRSAKEVSPGAVELSNDIEGLLHTVASLLEDYSELLPSLTARMTATEVVEVLKAEFDKEPRMLVHRVRPWFTYFYQQQTINHTRQIDQFH